MSVIAVNNLTKDYGNSKGVFDLSLDIKKGECFGFLGPNGAGKTTTIRNLMGFINSDKGSCTINGLDCRKNAADIQKSLGYIPGEIAFFDEMKGIDYLKFIASLRDLKDTSRMKELLEYFELDPSGKIKKMSKGMKQKIGLVAAFMHNPDVFILDEPTSGLDPLMQNKFVELIKSEQEKQKTILMSSHSFEEVEKTCERVGIIKNGKLVSTEYISELKDAHIKQYIITFENQADIEKFASNNKDVISVDGNEVIMKVKGTISPLLKRISEYEIAAIREKVLNLEDVFMHFYGGEKNDK